MVLNDMMVPTLAVGETFESEGNTYERYYVAYSQGLAIFESTDLIQAKTICNAVPTAINLMAATEVNEAPTVKKAYSYSSAMYERATSVKSCTAAKLTTCFTDAEGPGTDNITMYIREDVDWLDLTYATNGNITPKVKFTGDVDAKTEFVFTLECIDKYGASVKNTATLTITPRIYKPTITECELLIEGAAVEVSDSLAIAEVFNYTQSKTNLTFATTVTNVSDNLLISNAEIINNNLVVTIPENMSGVATVELTQSISHKTYGVKSFTANIPVIVEYDPTVGIQNVEISDIYISYINGNLTVNNCKGEVVAIYDIAGQLITSFTARDNQYTVPINLVEGIYIVNVGNLPVKIAVK